MPAHVRHFSAFNAPAEGAQTADVQHDVQHLLRRIEELTRTVAALQALAAKREEMARALAANTRARAIAEKSPPRPATFGASDAFQLSAQFAAMERDVYELQVARGLTRRGEAPKRLYT